MAANITYRCSRCRTRNRFKHNIGWYKIKRKCRDCACTVFYVDKERERRKPCKCDGAYAWGSHRLGSPFCMANPQWQAQRARRDGADDGEIAFEGLGLKPVLGEEIPF